MTWEADRYDWSTLGAMGSATGIPRAIESLRTADDSDGAAVAYWHIDNVAIVQGTLFEAAAPTAACLVVALQGASAVGRPRVLEALVQLSGAECPDNEHLEKRVAEEVSTALPTYLHIAQHGTQEEVDFSVDLLGACALHLESQKERIVWWFGRLLASADTSNDTRELIDNWLRLLAPQDPLG